MFRESALLRNAQPEPLDEPLRVTAPREWLLVAGLAVSLLGAVVWCAFAPVQQSLSGDGVLVRPGDRHAVTSPVSGVVEQVLVRPGDQVEAGQVVARLTLPELSWRLQVIRARVALLEDLAGGPRNGSNLWPASELAAARAEMLELAGIEAAGEYIVSQYAGEITESRLSVGWTVSAGEPVLEILADTGLAPETILLVAPEQAQRIDAGMKARISIPDRSRTRFFPAAVLDVSRQPAELPWWLSRLGPVSPPGEAPAVRWIVRLALDRGGQDIQVPDGVACRVHIVLARGTPFGLLIRSVGSAE